MTVSGTVRERTVSASSAADVQHAVRDAAARGAALRIVGSGNWLAAGRPVSATESLALRAMTGIVAYVPGDLTITVKAGTTLEEIDRETAEHRQWLALDPFGSRGGAIGATVATGSYGPLSASFGTPRDVVLGIECVTGDGELVHGGARVVKHVAGFDLVRLTTGAWGTLGILTTITLRLRARAPVEATFAVQVGSAPMPGWIAAYRAASVAPLAAELIAGEAAAALGLGGDTVALVRVSGNDEAVSAQENALRQLGDVRAVPSEIWTTLAVSDPAAPAVAMRLSHRAACLADVWNEAQRIAHGVPGARLHATIDRGVARIVIPHITESDALARLEAPAGFRCTRVFEVLPPHLWPKLSPSAVDDELSQRIRDAFDPERRLNPGILGET